MLEQVWTGRTYAVLFVPVQLAARRTGTLVAARRVDAAKFAAPTVDAAFINIYGNRGQSWGQWDPPALMLKHLKDVILAR